MYRLILPWSLFPKLAPASLSVSSWLFSTVPSSLSLTLPPFPAQPKLVTDPGICTCCSFCLTLSASSVSRHVLPYQGGFSGCLIFRPFKSLPPSPPACFLCSTGHSGNTSSLLLVPFSPSADLHKNTRCARAGTFHILSTAVFPVSVPGTVTKGMVLYLWNPSRFLHWFSKHLLSVYYSRAMVLGPGNIGGVRDTQLCSLMF